MAANPHQQQDLVENTPEICSKCLQEIPGQFISAFGASYHSECFRCPECGEKMTMFVKEFDDDLLCAMCVHRLDADWYRGERIYYRLNGGKVAQLVSTCDGESVLRTNFS